jgi:hypothetical protein
LLALVALMGFLPQLIGSAFNWIRDKAFPKTVFAIGQGAKRHSDKEVLRTVVIVGFVVSLVAGALLLLVPH